MEVIAEWANSFAQASGLTEQQILNAFMTAQCDEVMLAKPLEDSTRIAHQLISTGILRYYASRHELEV